MLLGTTALSMELSHIPAVGRYAGIVADATFGCTITFTIPVGMGMVSKPDRPLFAKGMLIGLGTMPVAEILRRLLFCFFVIMMSYVFVQRRLFTEF